MSSFPHFASWRTSLNRFGLGEGGGDSSGVTGSVGGVGGVGGSPAIIESFQQLRKWLVEALDAT